MADNDRPRLTARAKTVPPAPYKEAEFDITESALGARGEDIALLVACGWSQGEDDDWLMAELRYAAEATPPDPAAAGFLRSMACLVEGGFEATWRVELAAGAYQRWCEDYAAWREGGALPVRKAATA